MTKAALDQKLKEYADWAKDVMVTCHGNFAQVAFFISPALTVRPVVFREALHGTRMADTLRVLATGRTVDAILLFCDTRVKLMMSPEEAEMVRQEALRGNWIIADDPTCQEVLLASGRSREHTAVITMPYNRKAGPDGDVIVFLDDMFPSPDENLRFENYMIPNLWSNAH